MQNFVTRHYDEINLNEYRVYGLNGTEYTIIAARYQLKRDLATFWYWRKNIFSNRYEFNSFVRDGVKSVSQIIDAT